MKLEGAARIEQIAFADPFQPPILDNYKATIVDLKARDFRGNTYIIEIQVVGVLGMDNRILYYTSKEYSQQMEIGDKFSELNPVIFIGIFDFEFTGKKKYLSHHAICDVDTGERVIKGMDFFFIELPKFNKPVNALGSIIDKWVYFFKEAKNLEVIPDNVDDEGLKEAYLSASKFGWTLKELQQYDENLKFIYTERGKLDYVEEEGIAEGKEIGKKEQKIEIAKTMKAKGLDINFIIEITGLSNQEIENL